MNAKLEYPAENIGRRFQEVSRHVISGTAVETEYRAGYTTITVKSTFDSEHCFADLLYTVAVKRLERGVSA